MAADIEELESMDASEIRPRRINTQEAFTPQRVNISFSRSQMEQSSCLGEIRFSEEPPQFRITLHEAKSTTTIFKESRRSVNHWTRQRMMVESETIFGRSLGIFLIVVTLNPELNSM